MSKPYGHTSIDRTEPAAIEAFQLERIQALLQYLNSHSPFYQRLFADKGIDVTEINSLDAFHTLPLTSKEDIQLHNWDFLCVPRSAIAEYTATSGTLGQPVTIALTAADLERLAYNEYYSLQLMELSSADCLQLMLTLDKQFMAGMAYYKGAQQLGAAVIRTGPGLPQMQLEVMQRLQPSVLVAVPSFLVKLKEYIASTPSELHTLSPRKVLAIGESIRDKDLNPNVLAQRIQDGWNLELFGTYAATEMQTAFTECTAHQGGHLQPELLYVELLDEDGNPVTPGTAGEVTITTLGVEGMPLLRYQTGDLCRGYYDTCTCGRTTMRLGPVLGRKKQMIKYKGTSLYPPMVAEVLHRMDFISEYVIEITQDEYAQDLLVLHLHSADPSTVDHNSLKQQLQSALRVLPRIEWCSLEQMMQMQFPDGSRKPVRFRDRRA